MNKEKTQDQQIQLLKVSWSIHKPDMTNITDEAAKETSVS